MCFGIQKLHPVERMRKYCVVLRRTLTARLGPSALPTPPPPETPQRWTPSPDRQRWHIQFIKNISCKILIVLFRVYFSLTWLYCVRCAPLWRTTSRPPCTADTRRPSCRRFQTRSPDSSAPGLHLPPGAPGHLSLVTWGSLVLTCSGRPTCWDEPLCAVKFRLEEAAVWTVWHWLSAARTWSVAAAVN